MGNRLRAGRRKCRRCKDVFNKPSGVDTLTCPKCEQHCVRCNIEFTSNNRSSGRHKQYCKDCHSRLQSEYYSRNELKVRDKKLFSRFGITLDEYNAILMEQNGVCWICQRPPTGNALAVDHRHVLRDKQQDPRNTRTRVRGLLCWQCNAAIGKFHDDSKRLRRAAEYLETTPAQAVLKENE